MTSEPSPAVAANEAVPAPASARSSRRILGLAALAVIVIDALAVIVAGPAGFPDPKVTIMQNLEFVPPNVVWDLAPGSPVPTTPLVLTFHPSITASINRKSL
ncbi:MAG: hypothetical protein EPN50_00020, partial [Chloroflexota bacterium]